MNQEEKKSGLATAGMVLGIIAIVGCWIPFVNVVSIILGVLAFIFGIIPLIKKQSTGKAIAGVVLGVLSVIIGIYMTTSATKSIDKALNGESSSSVQKSDNTTPEKTKFSVNEVISFDQKEVTVTAVERNWNSNNQFIKPDSNKEFVKVQVTIKNNSANNISYNTYDWKLKDSTGDIQTVDGAAFTIEGALNSGELADGGTKSGFLIFQVPNGDTGLVLQYEPTFWSSKKLEIKL